MKACLVAGLSVLLGACAELPSAPPAALAPVAPIDWVCLLPDADGRVGRVAVQAGAGVPGTAVLEGAYNTARIASDGRLRFVQTDGVFMAERYGALLSTLPPRPLRLAIDRARLDRAGSEPGVQAAIAHLAGRSDAEVWLLHAPGALAQARAQQDGQMLARSGVDAARLRRVVDAEIAEVESGVLDLLLN